MPNPEVLSAESRPEQVVQVRVSTPEWDTTLEARRTETGFLVFDADSFADLQKEIEGSLEAVGVDAREIKSLWGTLSPAENGTVSIGEGALAQILDQATDLASGVETSSEDDDDEDEEFSVSGDEGLEFVLAIRESSE